MKIKSQRIHDAGTSITYHGNSVLIMENSDSGGCQTLETPNIFIFPNLVLIDGCMAKEWSEDPLEIPLGLMT